MGKTKNKPRVMVDSNVIISGITIPRFCFEILHHAIKQDFRLFLSEIIVWEVKRNIEKKFPAYILPFKDFLLKCPFTLIQSPTKEEVSKNKELVRDKSDIPIILSAIQAKVDFFVTGDKDIIDEISNIKGSISFLTPDVFLKKVMDWKSEELEAVIHRTWQNFNK